VHARRVAAAVERGERRIRDAARGHEDDVSPVGATTLACAVPVHEEARPCGRVGCPCLHTLAMGRVKQPEPVAIPPRLAARKSSCHSRRVLRRRPLRLLTYDCESDFRTGLMASRVTLAGLFLAKTNGTGITKA